MIGGVHIENPLISASHSDIWTARDVSTAASTKGTSTPTASSLLHKSLTSTPHVGVITEWSRVSNDSPCTRLAVCGSRAPGTEQPVIDEAVHSVARWLMTRRVCVIHGPVGVGIEIMTYIADHYRPDKLDSVTGVIGRHNIVAAAQYVLVIGGGSDTRDEVDMAFYLGLRVLPLPASGGTAARAYSMMSENPDLRAWLDGERFAVLAECNDTEAFLRIIEHALTLSPGTTT